MKKNWVTPAALAVALALGCGAANAAVVHNDGFTDGNNGSDYRSAGAFSVGVKSGSARTAAISFELFGARSVDGDNAWQDNYSFGLNGATLFDGTFDLGGGGNNVVFTNTNAFSYTPISFGAWNGGKVTVSGFVNLNAGKNQLTFGFASPGRENGGGQSKGDESWGVNNVTIAAVPVPAALPLLAGALAGLGALGRRRRKARLA